MTDTTDHPSRRAGLRDEIAAALEAADYRLDMRRGDLADAIMPVLYREWPWLRAEAEDAASAVVPAADRAALRDRIAEEHRLALSMALGLGTGAPWEAIHDRATELGLPPLDQDPVARRLGLLDEYRAKILTEAADAVFALDYDVMVGEEGDENIGSMREAWDLGTIHADKLLRRLAVESAVVDRVAAETPPAETHVELQVWPLQRILTEVRCGSEDWPWEEEWADLDRRHAETGYLDRLTEQIRENGITMPVLIGSDGRLWDGHHRLCVAARLGIGYVPVEIVASGSDQPGPVVPAQSGNDTTTPSVGYTGKGRVWCLTCPRPADENVPATIDIVRVGELCAGCGRDVVELARATEQPKKV
ncbi:ParB N-terminal domain-containing protein [Streptomyces caniscabiei]|uniref:hypothetical protein n=1 Tax=Streptomyces caniscabiei TaxID=2746961 RepID=UPI0029ABD3CA|nr:hypothetical protein [Streptomyces caniscabiei]MDX2986413.1 hypothetical protein [Streptomyces caniscabiei]